MLFRIYIYDQKVLIPNVAETDEGFYVDVKPVKLFEIGERDAWEKCIADLLVGTNELIATPKPSETGGSAILDMLSLQKWTAFEKKSVMYTVHTSSSYIRIYRTGKAPDGMWQANAINERSFDRGTPPSTIVSAIADDIMKQPEAHPLRVGGLILRPPEDS